MPRDARLIPQKGFLHIMCQGNNHRKLFLKPKDFKFYLFLLRKLKPAESVKILHYCLMPDHVHLMVEVTEQSNLIRFMKRLNLKYFYYYRKKYNYSGHLWRDRYKSKIIGTDEYFLECGKYIEINPVKAGLVKQPQEYLYSSYLFYAQGIKDNIVDIDPLYLTLADNYALRQQKYREMIINEMVYKKLAKGMI